MSIQAQFSVQDQVAVVTGGSGELGRGMVQALAEAGAKVAVLGTREETVGKVASAVNGTGGKALGVVADVNDRASLERALEHITNNLGPVDILVNGAGGNRPAATTSPERSFFDLDQQAIEEVLGLNFTGTVLASQVFGQGMAERGHGVIINITSMNGFRPLTRIPAYSAAKAAVTNFTQWLAVHMAQNYGPNIRVNAIAPGFF